MMEPSARQREQACYKRLHGKQDMPRSRLILKPLVFLLAILLVLLCYKLEYARFMSAHFLARGAPQKRLAAYLNGLAQAAGHADREEPLKAYCTGLLLPGERKSVEPMAARLSPSNVRRTHQSLHHLVAEAPWSDEAVLRRVREYALAAMTAKGPVVAWVVGDTGLVKKGTHSVGVARQYCRQVGKRENCQVAVSLSVMTRTASLPVAWRLYLPESWAENQERRELAGVPGEIRFETKPAIALGQIRWAVEEGIPWAPVVADAGYGNETGFREALTALDLPYVLGVNRATTVWKPGEGPLAEKALERRGQPPKRLRREGGSSAGFRLLAGSRIAGEAMEKHRLAGGRETSAPFAVCLAACPSRAWGRKAH